MLAHIRLAEEAEDFPELLMSAHALLEKFASLPAEKDYAKKLLKERLAEYFYKGESGALIPLLIGTHLLMNLRLQ